MTGQILSDEEVKQTVLSRQAAHNNVRIEELQERLAELSETRKKEEKAYWCLIGSLLALVIFLGAIR